MTIMILKPDSPLISVAARGSQDRGPDRGLEHHLVDTEPRQEELVGVGPTGRGGQLGVAQLCAVVGVVDRQH